MQTTGLAVSFGNNDAQSRASDGERARPGDGASSSSSYHDPRNKLQHVKTFLAQKTYRARRSLLMDKFGLWALTSASLLLSWLIGYLRVSWLVLVVLLALMVVLWREQSQRLVRAVEQEAELKMRKRRAVHHSETAEWVNVALNRWWMTCSESVLDFLRDYIEPLLNDIAPQGVDSLSLVEFDLANQTPFVKNIHVFDPPLQHSGAAPSSPSSRCKLVANMEIGLVAPSSKIVLRAKLGGKKFGYYTLVYVEGLHLSGSIQAVISIDFESPFPHVQGITATFIQKPDVWFSVKILKGLKVTEIPLLKNWIHSFVMDIFTTLLVDPGKISLNFFGTGPSHSTDPNPSLAKGVLSLRISGSPPEKSSQFESDARRWCTLRMGFQKYQFQIPTGRDVWKGVYCFLVQQPLSDVLMVKIKHRRVMRNVTLAQHSIGMESLQCTTADQRPNTKTLYMQNSEANVCLDLSYEALPSFSMLAKNNFNTSQVAGVLYIHVHSGSDLLPSDSDGLSDPYCVVLLNKKQVMSTHYVLNCLSPQWERGVEVFVADFTKLSVGFVVYDWDGPLVGDDILGAAKVNMEPDSPEMLQRQLSLELDGSARKGTRSLGLLTVSLVFRPMDCVSKADGLLSCAAQDVELTDSSTSSKRVKKPSKHFKSQKEFALGILEVHVLEGRNLVPKDANGLSDPYIVIKYSEEVVFRTKVVRNSLNPQWNECASLAMPTPEEKIIIECWDKDVFSDDFMGSAVFSASHFISTFEDGARWYKLDLVKSGEILLSVKRVVTHGQGLESVLEKGAEPEEQRDNSSSISSIFGAESANVRDSDQSDAGGPIAVDAFQRPLSPSGRSVGKLADEEERVEKAAILRRRHTIHTPPPNFPSPPGDLQKATFDPKLTTLERLSRSTRQRCLYHCVYGQVIEADGLKGELDNLELYIKLRLNTRPSYQRQHKFSRGPVIHKTRVLKGTANPQWREDFMVKETPLSSDSLLTVDLKSSSKVNIGTHAITLDKFFEGNIKNTRWLDIGNGMKLRIQLCRQPSPASSPIAAHRTNRTSVV